MAAAPSKLRKHPGSGEAKMPLSSMMDMMTIILLFLLKNYSTSGALLTQVGDLELPFSNVDTKPKTALSIVVDSGTDSGVVGVFVEHDGNRTEILDDGATLYHVPTGEEAYSPDAMILPNLFEYLQAQAAEGKEMEAQYGVPFEGMINIHADQYVNYNSILKVLATCGRSGYNKTEFVVVKSE